MLASQLFILDPDLRPRPGQKITLDYLGQEVPGVIVGASAVGLEIRPDGSSLLRHVDPNAYVRAVVIARSALSEVVLTRLSVVGDVISGQIVGHPVSIQRRADERVAVALAASLSWLDPPSGQLVQRRGVTANVCVSGARLRFPQAQSTHPGQDVVALLGLQLPGQDPLALSVRVLHAWQDGARVHIVDAAPPTAERLRTFVDAQLADRPGS